VLSLQHAGLLLLFSFRGPLVTLLTPVFNRNYVLIAQEANDKACDDASIAVE
jgi:hypothetical protein